MNLFGFYLIVIPTTIFNLPAPADLIDSARLFVKLALADAFGGYTETLSMGGYVAADGQLIEEQVYQIMALYSADNDELVKGLATRIKADLKQESVMVQKTQEVWFLYPEGGGERPPATTREEL